MSFESFAHQGLILSANARPLLSDPRALRRAVDSGELIKLRRGAYVESTVWESLSPTERHVMRVRAVVGMAHRQSMVAGFSAAALWGMPIAGDWPADVTILDEWLGGGRSEPGVKRTAAGFQTATAVEIGGIRVTNLARTAVDVARRQPVVDAVGSVDWALWRKNVRAISADELASEIRHVDVRAGRRHLERVASLATSLSDSFGESECRMVIRQLGFDSPELQAPIRDREGLMEPDFLWRSARIAGEFDGKLKYTRTRYTGGDPSSVVWEEKKREDRLRRHGLDVVRILTSHVKRPHRLERLLLDAGVPRGGR